MESEGNLLGLLDDNMRSLVVASVNGLITLLENHRVPMDVGLLLRLELVVTQRRSFEQDRLRDNGAMRGEV